MIALGLVYALLSGIANGLFTTPMKLIPAWKWENIWLVFILTSCLAMPAAMVWTGGAAVGSVLAAAPRPAVAAAVGFGFAWGFGAILFGLSVDRLGVSLANSLVIGLSSALGSVVPLWLAGAFRFEARQIVLLVGVAAFLCGVALCARAGRQRESTGARKPLARGALFRGYLFSIGAGIMSAVFNIGYSLALPISGAGQRQGLSPFAAVNLIWLLMLAAGSIPNIAFCLYRLRRHHTGKLFHALPNGGAWGLSILMGLLWGGSIFLYGAATPLLGDIGPSIGWPLSLAMGLLVANLMGYLLGEWRTAPREAVHWMQAGILTLVAAILICAYSTRV